MTGTGSTTVQQSGGRFDLEKGGAMSQDGASGDSTTVMLKHISCRMTGEELEQFLDSVGLSGTYNFVYIPCRHSSKKRATSFGYAFVNFWSIAGVAECKKRLEGLNMKLSPTTRPVEVLLAARQDFSAKMRSRLHFPRAAEEFSAEVDSNDVSNADKQSTAASSDASPSRSSPPALLCGVPPPPGLVPDSGEYMHDPTDAMSTPAQKTGMHSVTMRGLPSHFTVTHVAFFLVDRGFGGRFYSVQQIPGSGSCAEVQVCFKTARDAATYSACLGIRSF